MSDFLLPDIGEGIVECEVVEWRVAEGDTIEEDQPIVEVMTDKALVEITAPEAGTVTKLYVPQGKIAKVHAPLYAYQGAEEGAKESAEEVAEKSSENPRSPASDAADTSKPPPSTPSPNVEQSAPQCPTEGPACPVKTPASPAVRRLVREHRLVLADIAGSGKDGRVLKEDVLAHVKSSH
ncbi:biotin/lipoyl-containing protein, partial [Halomonas sp. BC1]|uniref:biotin/lipoyl-containing protein n=1 Tax=Halomonas sp. BC1 TaxID=1670448 RepID=UPI001592B015